MPLLLALASGFASGVFLRSLFAFSWPVIGFALLLAAASASFWVWKPRQASALCAVFFLLCALGMARAAAADTPLPSAFAPSLRHRVSYEATVIGFPDVRDANERVIVRVRQGGQSTRMLAVAPRYERVSAGDRVYVSGTLEVPQPFSDNGGRTFRYDRYLQREGVRFLLNYAYLRVERHAPWYSIPALLGRTKRAYLSGLDTALPEPYASLASGITLGGKSGLGPELTNAFTKSGIVQIIVLSGYHVMLVVTGILALLEAFGMKKKRAALAAAGAIVLFVLIAGAGPAAIRALIMALIALYAQATTRSYAAGRALLAAVLLMLLWNPLLLAFDPGFSLSVAATAGLIWFAPRVESRLGFIAAPGMRNALSVTFSAQLFVLPLLLYFMGTLSLVAIPVNLVAMPLVPAAMVASAIAGLSGMVFGGFAQSMAILIGFPAYLLTFALIFVTKQSAALSWAALSVPSFPFAYVAVAYVVLGYFAASKRFSTTPQLRLSKNAST